MKLLTYLMVLFFDMSQNKADKNHYLKKSYITRETTHVTHVKPPLNKNIHETHETHESLRDIYGWVRYIYRLFRKRHESQRELVFRKSALVGGIS